MNIRIVYTEFKTKFNIGDDVKNVSIHEFNILKDHSTDKFIIISHTGVYMSGGGNDPIIGFTINHKVLINPNQLLDEKKAFENIKKIDELVLEDYCKHLRI